LQDFYIGDLLVVIPDHAPSLPAGIQAPLAEGSWVIWLAALFMTC
jgi:hypothetical protein